MHHINIESERLLTVNEAAVFLRVTSRSIRRYMSQGIGNRRLASVKVGGRVLTSKEAINRFVGTENVAPVLPKGSSDILGSMQIET